MFAMFEEKGPFLMKVCLHSLSNEILRLSVEPDMNLNYLQANDVRGLSFFSSSRFHKLKWGSILVVCDIIALQIIGMVIGNRSRANKH